SSAIGTPTSKRCWDTSMPIRYWWILSVSADGGAIRATTMASAGSQRTVRDENEVVKAELYHSIARLCHWLEAHDYQGYETFDGLSARYMRPLTFETKLLRTVLQQGIRRFPINLRTLLGRSTKAMGFFARGFSRLHEATGDRAWRDKAEHML